MIRATPIIAHYGASLTRATPESRINSKKVVPILPGTSHNTFGEPSKPAVPLLPSYKFFSNQIDGNANAKSFRAAVRVSSGQPRPQRAQKTASGGGLVAKDEKPKTSGDEVVAIASEDGNQFEINPLMVSKKGLPSSNPDVMASSGYIVRDLLIRASNSGKSSSADMEGTISANYSPQPIMYSQQRSANAQRTLGLSSEFWHAQFKSVSA